MILGSSREQALLNEYKGNIFEFLVGQFVAKNSNLEDQYLKNIDPESLVMLKQYESFIRQFHPALLRDLPTLALSLSNDINEFLKSSNILEVGQVGKKAASLDDEKLGEADLLIKTDSKTVPVSIKMSKQGAYVNTKSAGVKSFLTKYFHCKQAILLQEDFNRFFDNSYLEMMLELHNVFDILFDEDLVAWNDQGLPHLSGELKGEAREVYRKFLVLVNQKIYKCFENIFLKNPGVFLKGILPLIGLSNDQVILANCFYTIKDGRYNHKSNHIVGGIPSLDNVKIVEPKSDVANFNIDLGSETLQVRIKAMNKFTNRSFKINCSVKYH